MNSSSSLPIYRNRAEILDAFERHQVIVVEGPTGCGKTTQLPRILLRSNLVDGLIGVTQPRRIAAVSVAWRIASEVGVEVGEEVGYAIRFDDRTGSRTRVKVMTDGILLQEARSDPDFSAYDVIIVDEAHERSLNIDLTLGLLHRALTRRSDLKLIISSATLEPEVFQRYFTDVARSSGRASTSSKATVPLISIDDRPHPVDIQHVPVSSSHPSQIARAVAHHVASIHGSSKTGDILVFLTGIDLIRRSQRAIDTLCGTAALLVLPLYGHLPREEQERVFDPVFDRRKVILATNIAETSITVPGVRFVIDCGLAKIPRFRSETGVTTLREEPISRASAEQRAGRAGRTAPGHVVRLYDKRSFQKRPEFTDEEICRLDLSEVVLRLLNLGVWDVESFPFPTEPPLDQVRAAVQKLKWMGAIDRRRNLTGIGRQMVPYPLSPALARMVVEAQRFPNVVDEVLIVSAFLSTRPPYLFPEEGAEVERDAHHAFAHQTGDTMTAVKLFRAYRRARNLEAFCDRFLLDPDIMAFIDKTFHQLAETAEEHGIQLSGGGNPAHVIRCLATGFPERVLTLKGRIYLGRANAKAAIHPSSVLFGQTPPFIIAAELVCSKRTFARHVSIVEPHWVRDLRPELFGNPKRGRSRRSSPPRHKRQRGRGRYRGPR